MNINYCMGCFSPLQLDGVCPSCGFSLEYYTPESHHIPPETILNGRYLVGKVLGEGGFGITYLGFDLKLERKVAIKEYFPNGNVWRNTAGGLAVSCYSTKNYTEAFDAGKNNCMKEARALAKLDDIDSVVRVLDHFLENNTAYVIMEYIDGVTLKEYVLKLPSRLSFDEVTKLLLPVMKSLSTMHNRGFIHRDISPDNIMVTPEGKAKLLDFGTVKSFASGGSYTENPTVKRGFSPLEQYSSDGRLGQWTDVYSMCATMYYLLTGTTVPEPVDRLDRGSNEMAERLRGSDVPDSVLPVLLKGLEVQPQDRLQSMEELTVPLEAAVQKQTPKKKKWIIPVVAVLMAAVVALVAYIFLSSDSTPKNYTYGRDLANMITDGRVISDGNKFYITDYYDAEHAQLYSLGSEVNVELDQYAYQLNVIRDKIYFVDYDDRAIYSYQTGNTSSVSETSADEESEGETTSDTALSLKGNAATQVYKGGAIMQMVAVDTGKQIYLFFTEVSGTQFYIQRLDVDSKEKTTISSSRDGIMFSIHNNLIYYIDDNNNVWTVSMDGKNEKCIVQDQGVRALCFEGDSMYLQTEDSVVEASLDGKIKDTLEGLDPVFELDDKYISPILGHEGKLYYTDSKSRYLYEYDLSKKKAGELLVEATCFDYEISGDELFYTTMATDVQSLHCLNLSKDDDEPVAFCMWATLNTENMKYYYGVGCYGNTVNGSICATEDDTLYYLMQGKVYYSELEDAKATAYSGVLTNGETDFVCINTAEDDKYFVENNANYSGIVSVESKRSIYKGRDVHNLQYFKRDDFKKLLFTDKDENGDYYAYSIDIDGQTLTRISHVPCAPDSLDNIGEKIIYTDAERKHLYSACVTGQQINEDYECFSVDDDDLTIHQASFHGTDKVYISVNGGTDKNRFLTIDPSTGEIIKNEKAEIADFNFCGSKLYATDPTTSYLYCYESPKTDLTNRKLILDHRVDAVNVFEYDEQQICIFRTEATGYLRVVNPDDYSTKYVEYFDFRKIFAKK